MGSTRLPGKVLRPLAGRPALLHVLERVGRARGLAGFGVATTAGPADLPLRRLCAEQGIPCFAGSELDVLDRYHGAALAFGADPVLRVTADCPLLDADVVE